MVRVKATPSKRLVSQFNDEGVEETEVLSKKLKKNKTLSLRHNIDCCQQKAPRENWVHISTWALIQVETVADCDICLFVQGSHDLLRTHTLAPQEEL